MKLAMPTYRLSVNGATKEVSAASEMPLLWVLRDLLDLPGTKFGCGVGQCRACTVHLDGQPIASCQLAVGQVQGRAVTTIEGLSADASHPLQKAWIEEQVPQCGYCQSGQIMSAAALLAEQASPSDEQIDVAMIGNICRCGSYNRIRRAIRRAAQSGEGE